MKNQNVEVPISLGLSVIKNFKKILEFLKIIFVPARYIYQRA